MTVLLRHLSWPYLRRSPGRALLGILGIAVGVATFVAVAAAQNALVTDLQASVGRLADRADLEITGLGGVPEALGETVQSVDGVAAAQPVIEQVVQPVDGQLGALLVMGVDLVSDASIRTYRFDGENADVEDPLVFLAQPDSIAISRPLAARAGLRLGDRLAIRLGDGIRQLVVRAVLADGGFGRAFGGNVAITDVYAAEDLFGRGRRFDRLELRLSPGTLADEAARAIGARIGSTYRIETPEQRGAGLERLADAVGHGFSLATLAALGIGLLLVFNVFAIAVQRRRRDIGILRALGATAGQTTIVFLIEAALLGAAGAGAGLLLGRALAGGLFHFMAASVTATGQVVDGGMPALTTSLAGQALLVGTITSLVAAWLPARRAARVPPAAAVAAGTFNVRVHRISRRWLAAGLALMAAAVGLDIAAQSGGHPAVLWAAAAGGVGTAIVSAWTGRAMVTAAARVLARVAPASGRLALAAVAGYPRRTAASVAVLTVCGTFVLGVAGYLSAVEASFNGWIDNAAQADLVVRAGAGWRSSTMHLPGALVDTLRAEPGVMAVDAVRTDRLDYRGHRTSLVSIDPAPYVARTRHRYLDGSAEALAAGLSANGGCAITAPLALRWGLGRGDRLTLQAPTGAVTLRIAAVIDGDRDQVLVDRRLFAGRWQNDQVDAINVMVQQGRDAARMRDAMRRRLASGTPALISTRDEFVEDARQATTLAVVAMRTVAAIAVLVAMMGVASSQALSLAQRTRDIGMLRAVGATAPQIVAAVALEAVTLAAVSLLMAVPLGEVFAWILRVHVSTGLAGYQFPRHSSALAVASLMALWPGAALVSAWLPVRQAMSVPVTRAVEYE